MPNCEKQNPTLSRRGRDYVAWDVTGVQPSDSVDVSLEGGPWWPMAIGTDVVTVYLAGPDFASPGSAHPVPVTSHAEIRVQNDLVSVIFDAGFVELVP